MRLDKITATAKKLLKEDGFEMLEEENSASSGSEEEKAGLPAVQLISKEILMKAMPKTRKDSVSDEFVAKVNDLLQDENTREMFRDNLLGFTRVLQDARVDLNEYVNAIKYTSYKLLGDSNLQAWTKTFPERLQRLLDRGAPEIDIHRAVHSFSRTYLVTSILEQSTIPTWILNQDLYQKAINATADLMMNAKSEKVRADAANNLMVQLKMPEVAKVTLDIKQTESDALSELRKSTLELVAQQRAMMQAGLMNARQVAEMKVIHGEVIERGQISDS